MTEEQVQNTETSETEQQDAVQADKQGFGAVLRQAREACGYTIGDMVGRVRISVKQLRAIESEEVDLLPEPVYVRGFIRAYAKSLGIDSTALVEDYNTRFAPVDTKVAHAISDIGYTNEQVFSERRPSSLWRIIPLVLLVAAVAAGAWAVLNQKMLEEKQEAAVNPAVETTQAASRPVAAEPAKVAPKRPEIPGVKLSPDDASAVSVAEPGEVRLRFQTKSSAWVRVSRIGDDRTVFEQEMPAGSVRVVHAAKPVRVILGSTDGVKVEVNGVDCDYSEFVSSADKTARFRLH